MYMYIYASVMLNWPRTSNLTISSNGFNVAQHFLTQALRHDGELECFMHDGTKLTPAQAAKVQTILRTRASEIRVKSLQCSHFAVHRCCRIRQNQVETRWLLNSPSQAVLMFFHFTDRESTPQYAMTLHVCECCPGEHGAKLWALLFTLGDPNLLQLIVYSPNS